MVAAAMEAGVEERGAESVGWVRSSTAEVRRASMLADGERMKNVGQRAG
jgi:hypothetical protein